MKGLPLPYDLEGKGAFDLGIFSDYSSSSGWIHRNNFKESCFFVDNNNNNNNNCRGGSVDTEPTSVLDTLRIQSPPTSTSTLSSSLGGGNTLGGGGGGVASTDTTGVAAVYGNSSTKWHPNAASATSSNIAVDPKFQAAPTSFPMGVASTATTGILAGEECSLEEWDSVLPESVAASPNQEQNILRWIMGDVDDPSLANLNKVLQSGSGGGGGQAAGYEFNSDFGVADQGFGDDDSVGQGTNPNLMPNVNQKTDFLATSSGNIAFNQEQQQQLMQPFDSDPMRPFYSPQVLVNQQQTEHPQNPTFFMPMPYADQEENLVMPPQAKRHNPGPMGDPKAQFLETGSIPFMGRHAHLQPQQVMPPYQLQLLPGFLQQRPNNAMKPKMVGEDAGQHQQQQIIIDQLYKAMDFVQTGNPLLAQTILARLNQQLSPIGKPFYRSAFYFKEALQLLLNTNTLQNPYSSNMPPSSLIFKIGAYKSFSEVSPVVQFANFTCNQALLEVLQEFDRIHIIDFDIGYGGQWASFIQELSLRNGGPPSLKITAFSSPYFHDQLELGFTKENLNHFASETNLDFEFEIVSVESISSLSWSLPFHVSENEAIGVNLPLSSFTNFHLSMPMVLHFIKQLSPKIVVSLERGWDRTDLPFPNHVIHALQSYSNLLESVDAVNVNSDSLQKIERFLIQPGIEKMLLSRYRSPDKTQQHWKALFMSSGFVPLNFSNFTESLAECVVKRTPVRGFHIEKRQSSFVLCWQRKELISASAWRC